MQGRLMAKRVSFFLPFLLLLGMAALWVTNCSGPRPVVSDPQVEAPTAPDKPYYVTVRVQNDSPGHGQVQLVFRLRDIHSGHVYQQSEQVTLRSGETAVVGVDISAPSGEYQPNVTASYPP
ncbi:MAG TPA: hypothetical protein VFU88_14770 [Ktedonobacterales bacterium]|nr:hypothetical protein [Ktedonobacterales bacterium]